MEGEGTPRMRFVACGRDDKKPCMRMVQAGRKRSTGDRSPERNSDEDLDIMEDVHSVVAAVHAERGAEQRGEIHQRFAEMFNNLHFQFFPEPPQERQSGGQQFRKLVPHWTDASRMTLIEEVSKKRNLWDITSAAYKDKQRSDVDWHHVKEELNAAFNSCYEVDDVKKQWKNLRDSFQKRMKAAKEPKTGSSAGDPPTKWIFWEAMQFLLDFNDEEPTMSNVGQYGLSSGGTSTAHYATSESRSGSNSPAPSRLGFRADVPRKAALEKKKGDGSKSTALSRICSELGTMNHELGTMNHELGTMNQSPQTGDQFDAFGFMKELFLGAFASTTLRKLAATDEEAAELVVLELSENLSKLVREALVRKRSVR
ncbi:unnamed protein product [Heligmosomoides polygyrus]|uniref:MADF domain-containing protein n=1 Tax=Heligmosomoides polygyrus TaxID=6339 RepID=A0A183GUF2_HELPZ|nr:unnamed protein product [Heligmosomoides polygyrus]